MTDFNIKFYDKLPSTNSYALSNILELQDKDVILAEIQSRGRGRFDRKWESAQEGNIYMSLVLKPTDKVTNNLPLANLTQYMCLCVARVLEDYGVSSHIKWPNDIQVDGKKISGILSEVSIQGEHFKGFVLGVGINLNVSSDIIENIDQPATSLSMELGTPINRDMFLHQILTEFFNGYESFLMGGFLSIKDEYINKINFIGQDVQISQDRGIAKAINNDGSLKILKDGKVEKDIMIGDLICL